MILFTILSIVLILSIIFMVLVAGTAGAVGIIVFGDVIVCGFLIVWVLKHLLDKND